MTLAATRAELAARQAEVVRHLSAAGPLPVGFAPGSLAVAKDVLAGKRRRQLVQHLPALAAALGSELDAWLARFFAAVPPRADGEGAQDALAFVRFVRRLTVLPRAALREAARCELASGRHLVLLRSGHGVVLGCFGCVWGFGVSGR